MDFFFSVERQGPLSTFGVQIRAAVALGLIPKTMWPALDTIRKLRNEFAHVAKPVELSNVDAESIVNSVKPSLREAISAVVDVRDNVVVEALGQDGSTVDELKSWADASMQLSKYKVQFATAALLVWAHIRLAPTKLAKQEFASLPLFA